MKMQKQLVVNGAYDCDIISIVIIFEELYYSELPRLLTIT